MTYSSDFRWRAVSLIHIYGVSQSYVSEIFGPKLRTIRRLYKSFLTKGTVDDHSTRERSARWPTNILEDVQKYVSDHPTFFIEELQDYLKSKYPDLTNVSNSTTCRALNFDLNLSRKVLTQLRRILNVLNRKFSRFTDSFLR